ncbi:glycosyltransferase family 39 protein [bacterium]|nr:glycosyltransferase family 39 protein [bacterium]
MTPATGPASRDREGAASPPPVLRTQLVVHDGRRLAVAARWRRLLPILAVTGVIALFTVRLGHRELYSSHEARAAQNAQRMLDTGEWGLPVLFDGRADLQKPPAYYWLVAAAGWVTGGAVDELAARLPSALAGLLTVALVYWFLKREGRPVAAAVAALTLATAGHFTAISRTARIDVPLTCTVAAALPGSGVTRYLWFLLSAAAAATGVMLKGPVALALVGPAAVAWLAVKPRGDRWALPPLAALLGVTVVSGLAAPWFAWANHATGGEFGRVFFWHHNVERFAGTSPTLASHPVWYYLPRFAADFLPWTPALALLAWWAGRAGAWRADPLVRFGAVWFATMFAVLSAAQFKRADYLLPLYPGAAIVLGCAGERWLATRTDPRTVRRAGFAFALTLAGVAVGWGVMTAVVEPAEQAREGRRAFAEFIRTHAPAPEPILVFRAESHLLSFHLGMPQENRVEWHDLAAWLDEPGPRFVVMPPEYVYPAGEIVKRRRLVEVGRLEQFTGAKPPKPLVFLRTAD